MSATRLRTLATFAALSGGLAWILDVSVITAIDDSFDPLDSILFLYGLAALVASAGLGGALVSQGLRGARRAIVGVGVALASSALLTLASITADAVSHALYHGGNRGLHNECGIFVMGVSALAGGAWLRRRPTGRTRDRRPTPAVPSAARGSR